MRTFLRYCTHRSSLDSQIDNLKAKSFARSSLDNVGVCLVFFYYQFRFTKKQLNFKKLKERCPFFHPFFVSPPPNKICGLKKYLNYIKVCIHITACSILLTCFAHRENLNIFLHIHSTALHGIYRNLNSFVFQARKAENQFGNFF